MKPSIYARLADATETPWAFVDEVHHGQARAQLAALAPRLDHGMMVRLYTAAPRPELYLRVAAGDLRRVRLPDLAPGTGFARPAREFLRTWDLVDLWESWHGPDALAWQTFFSLTRVGHPTRMRAVSALLHALRPFLDERSPEGASMGTSIDAIFAELRDGTDVGSRRATQDVFDLRARGALTIENANSAARCASLAMLAALHGGFEGAALERAALAAREALLRAVPLGEVAERWVLRASGEP